MAALEAIHKSERKFVDILNENCPLPEQLTYGGQALVRLQRGDTVSDAR